MHDMYEMLLIMNMQQSYADDLERQNERLRQQLQGLGIEPYGGAGNSTARSSNAYYNEPSREWSLWPDPYQQDNAVQGWSPQPDTHQHDN